MAATTAMHRIPLCDWGAAIAHGQTASSAVRAALAIGGAAAAAAAAASSLAFAMAGTSVVTTVNVGCVDDSPPAG